MLELLKFVVRGQVWITIAKVDYQPDSNLVIFKMVKIGTSQGSSGRKPEWPADRMDDFSRDMFCGINIPYFLETNAVVLCI